jgi:ABC-type multidrug transport system permease subunit
MCKTWIVAWNDLQMVLRSKSYWLLLLALPALAIYLIGLGAQGIARAVPDSIRLDVWDQDNSPASAALIAALVDALRICPLNHPAPGVFGDGTYPPQPDCSDTGAPFATLFIPEDFGAALERGSQATLIFQPFLRQGRPGAGQAAPEIAYAAVQSAVTRLGGPVVAARLSTEFAKELEVEAGPEFYAARLAEAEASWARPPVQVLADATRPDDTLMLGAQLMENGFKVSTPSIAAMFVMISVFGLAHSLAEERTLGIWQRVGTMPVSKAQWLGGKLLAVYLMGVLQFGALLGFGQLLGVEFGRSPFATALVAMAYVLAVTALALALATLARAPNQASLLTTFAWMVLVPLGGGWWPLALVPEWMQVLGHLSPVAWCLDALNALIFYDRGFWTGVLQPVGVLLIFAAVCFVFGVQMLRRKPEYGYSKRGDIASVVPFFGARLDEE